MLRYELCPAKIELIDGHLFWTEDDRLTMLGLLLENVGADKAVRLGDSKVWREAVAGLSRIHVVRSTGGEGGEGDRGDVKNAREH